MNKIYAALEKKGPLSGKELIRETGMTVFSAWKSCAVSGRVVTQTIGRRYLRLDSKVEGYARLSPSIMREFLNYTVVGLKGSEELMAGQAKLIEEEIREISRRKIELARETVDRLVANHPEREILAGKTCFLIAGDVVFGMAHAEPRPESSTGELVRGSDLDIITVTDGLAGQLVDSLDELLYREKYNLLMNPAQKEEIDYIVKDLDTVEQQLQFDDFKKKVASKILDEGLFLSGSPDLYRRVKKMVADYDIPEKLRRLEENASRDRIEAEQQLLAVSGSAHHDQLMALFYTTEEKEEIF